MLMEKTLSTFVERSIKRFQQYEATYLEFLHQLLTDEMNEMKPAKGFDAWISLCHKSLLSASDHRPLQHAHSQWSLLTLRPALRRELVGLLLKYTPVVYGAYVFFAENTIFRPKQKIRGEPCLRSVICPSHAMEDGISHSKKEALHPKKSKTLR